MIVFLDGRFVPESEAVVSVFDRSFRYGDGLFEAVRAVNGRLFRARLHLERLRQSADALRITVLLSDEQLLGAMAELLQRNELRDAVLRIQLSRGTGPRGYAPTGTEQPVIVISVHAIPDFREAPQWKLVSAALRVPAGDALAHYKTCSRLMNVLVAAEVRQAGADEGLLIDTDGYVTEGSSSNVFWVQGNTVGTTPLSSAILPGVTRRLVLELCATLNIAHVQARITVAELIQAEGVFVTLTSRGIVEVAAIDGTPIRNSPTVTLLRQHLCDLVARECA